MVKDVKTLGKKEVVVALVDTTKPEQVSEALQPTEVDPQVDTDGDGEPGDDPDYRLFRVIFEGKLGDIIMLSFNHNEKSGVRGVINADAIKGIEDLQLNQGATYNLRIRHTDLTQMLINTGE
jgi:hypothetical protein